VSLDGFKPLEVERLGGLATFPRAEDVPVGWSPDCQNVRFRPGSVETRLGLTTQVTPSIPVYGLAQFISNVGTKSLVFLSSGSSVASLYHQDGAPNVLQSAVCQPSARLNSILAFNRIWFAFFESGPEPAGALRHWVGVTPSGGEGAVDPLCPSGPGGAPTAADSTNAGTITAGLHKVRVVFETRSAYLTEPSPPASWTAAGSKKAVISNIPTGPNYVTARRLIFTAAAGEDLFYLSTFRIADNTTTSVEVDFSDLELQQGNNVNVLLRNFLLPEQTGIGSYHQRLIAWGGLNCLKLNNAGFDGGFAAAGEPLGWQQGTNFAGGSKSLFGYKGECWRITGDGVTAVRGEILLPVASVVEAKVTYEISVRAAWLYLQPPYDAALHINLEGTGVSTPGLTIPANSIGQTFLRFRGNLTPEGGLTSVPSDLKLRVRGINTIPSETYLWVDEIEIYKADQKFDASVARVSDAEDPERFDGINGFIVVRKDDGQKIIAGAEQRGFYYFFKERSVHATYDDGANPASLWPLHLISEVAGAASPNAVAAGESFIITAARAGAYLIVAGRATKLSKEIEPTWERINWTAAHTIHTLLDAENNRVHFFVPLDANTAPLHALVLDYTEGFGADEDPGGRKWSIDSFPAAIRASLRYENATGGRDLYLGGTKVYKHTGTSDDGTAINSYYETAYLKAGKSGQDLFGGVALNVAGAGTLTASLRGLNDVPTEDLPNQVLATAPSKDNEMYANLESEKARLRMGTNAVGAYFQLKRVCIYAQPWAAIRAL